MLEVRYIRDRNEQFRIAQACHADKTSGHLGYRKKLARITERFAWKGVSKDAKEIVRCIAISYIASIDSYIRIRINYIGIVICAISGL